MKKKYIIFSLLTLALSLAVGISFLPQWRDEGYKSSGYALARTLSKSPVPVVTAIAMVEMFSETLEALGTAKANESVIITPTLEERVANIFFEDGDSASKGQILVKLDDSEARYELEEAKAALREQQKQYERIRTLAKTNSTSRSKLDEEQSLLEIAEAKVALLETRLRDYTIRAPFSGILGIRQISSGAVVDSDTLITTLDDITIIKLDFTVPEIYLGVVQNGMSISAKSPAYPDKKFSGTVTAISSRIDPETRSLTVRAKISNPDRLLKPGMLLTVDLVKDLSQALIIPEEAVIQYKDKKFVQVVETDNTVEKKEIVTGRRSPGKVEVVSGLNAGQQVIIKGLTRVKPGSSVNVVEIHKTGHRSGSLAVGK
jgi:membrane fusion protein (multidrug efflux system)